MENNRRKRRAATNQRNFAGCVQQHQGGKLAEIAVYQMMREDGLRCDRGPSFRVFDEDDDYDPFCADLPVTCSGHSVKLHVKSNLFDGDGARLRERFHHKGTDDCWRDSWIFQYCPVKGRKANLIDSEIFGNQEIEHNRNLEIYGDERDKGAMPEGISDLSYVVFCTLSEDSAWVTIRGWATVKELFVHTLFRVPMLTSKMETKRAVLADQLHKTFPNDFVKAINPHTL
jgi:hypothetical protein